MRYFYTGLLAALSLLATGCSNMKGHYEYELGKAKEREEKNLATITELQEENRKMRNALFELKKGDHVMVIGEINEPGIYYVGDEASLVEVIEMAGGETRFTSRRAVINRGGNRIEIDTIANGSAQIVLLPGDVLYFSRLLL